MKNPDLPMPTISEFANARGGIEGRVQCLFPEEPGFCRMPVRQLALYLAFTRGFVLLARKFQDITGVQQNSGSSRVKYRLPRSFVLY